MTSRNSKIWEATDDPGLWIELLKGHPGTWEFYCEDIERPFTAYLDLVEYGARKAAEKKSSWVQREAEHLFWLIGVGRQAEGDNCGKIRVRLFWEIESVRGELLKAYRTETERQLKRIGQKFVEAGHKSKRTKNPGILAAVEKLLKKNPKATSWQLWNEFARLCEESFADEDGKAEGFDVDTDKRSFTLSMDCKMFESNPWETPLCSKSIDSGKTNAISWSTFEKTYVPLARQNLGIAKKKKLPRVPR